MWDISEKKLLLTLVDSGADGWLAWTPDGLFDGPASAWRKYSWRFSNVLRDQIPVEAFVKEFYHPGLIAAIMSGNRPMPVTPLAGIDRRQPKVQIRAGSTRGGSEPTALAIAREVTLEIEVEEALSSAGSAGGSGAKDLRLFRNGTLIWTMRGDLLQAGRTRRTVRVSVAATDGGNQFTAYAFSKNDIKSADASLVVQRESGIRRRGTARILAIGVNDYGDSNADLRYAVADAELFSNALKTALGALNEYEEVKVVRLLDREATKVNILTALQILGGTLRPDELKSVPEPLSSLTKSLPEDGLFVYFSGHGFSAGNRFYFVPYDRSAGPRLVSRDPSERELLAGTSVSERDLERALEFVDGRRFMLVFDACDSGQALEAQERRRGPLNAIGLAQLAYEKGVYILTATQPRQDALESFGLGHGSLTYALVEEGLQARKAFRGGGSQALTARDWLDYAAWRVPELERGGLSRATDSRGLARRPQAQQPRTYYRREAESEPFLISPGTEIPPTNRQNRATERRQQRSARPKSR